MKTAYSKTEFQWLVQKESRNMVGQEQARRRRAEVALEAAVTEVGTAQQGKTMAEMEAEKAQHMLELEVKLRQQISKEKDQVCIHCLDTHRLSHHSQLGAMLCTCGHSTHHRTLNRNRLVTGKLSCLNCCVLSSLCFHGTGASWRCSFHDKELSKQLHTVPL